MSLKIGEVAQRGDVSLQAIRYYEREGLLPKPLASLGLWLSPFPRHRRAPGRPPTGRISVHVFLDKKLDEELSRAASREGVHRSLIVERALAKELQVSVNHNDPRETKRGNTAAARFRSI